MFRFSRGEFDDSLQLPGVVREEVAEGCASLELLQREPLLGKKMVFDEFPSLLRHDAAAKVHGGDWFAAIEDRGFYRAQHQIRRDPDLRMSLLPLPKGEVITLD